jgi:hypothetical protein
MTIQTKVFAEVHAWRSETNQAFEWLQISFDNNATGTLSLSIDPLMRGLRGDTRRPVQGGARENNSASVVMN